MGKKTLPGRLPVSVRVGSRSVDANESAETPVTDDPSRSELDLVAIGSPLLDVLESTRDEVLAELGLAKGSMTLIDLAQADAIQGIMADPRFVSGGSVANTAVGLAELGGRAGFVGAVADDAVGQTYVENLRAAGVTCWHRNEH